MTPAEKALHDAAKAEGRKEGARLVAELLLEYVPLYARPQVQRVLRDLALRHEVEIDRLTNEFTKRVRAEGGTDAA